MFTIVISERGGETRRIQFDENEYPEIRIGRAQSNDIILPKANVSKHHAVLMVRDGKFIIKDKNSTNGTYVNQRRITGSQIIRPGDWIVIGDFALYIETESSKAAGGPPPPPVRRKKGTVPPPPPKRGATVPPPPPKRAPQPAAAAAGVDDDFLGLEEDWGESPKQASPSRSTMSSPPADIDDFLGEELEKPPARPQKKEPELPEPPDFEDDLLDLEEPAPQPSRPKEPSPAPQLEDDLGLEDDFGLGDDDLGLAPPTAPARPESKQSEPEREPDLGLDDLDFDSDIGLEAPEPAPPKAAAAPPRRGGPARRPPVHQAPEPAMEDEVFEEKVDRHEAPTPSSPMRSPEGAKEPAAAPEPAPARPEPAAPARPAAVPRPKATFGQRPKSKRRLDPKMQKKMEILRKVHDKLIERMDLRRLNIDEIPEDELWDRADAIVCDIVDDMAAKGEIPSFIDQDELIKDVLNEALGLGPLQDLIDDDTVTEIMVNHASQIYVERQGRIEKVDKIFSSDEAVMKVIERIVAPIGRRIDESSPLVDARLKDGSRVNAIIPPLAIKGPAITIRKFKRDVLTVEQLMKLGTLTKGMADFLKMCVLARKNIVISGGTGSGKTTTLNVLSTFIPEGERIITIEDAAELQIQQEHWIQLESRPPNIEGKGAITIRDLLKNTLRMRPDRIIVGECRGGEALDMLQAMNTGHDGSMTTVHANSPRDAISRLETMVLMSGMDLPVKAIREQIASAVDIIVQQTRFSDGSRKITYITEVTGMEGDIITMQDIFRFRQHGYDENNRVVGEFVPTGFIPKFYEDLRRRGIPVDMSIFQG